ncbi:MAG: SDR family NAD-dependent epimerase/dehydratase, partial [Xanthomonadales bacterium]|nr:SDR family NAD-dependent epimerase/dehydratase [Xanthomonadales bacterium]
DDLADGLIRLMNSDPDLTGPVNLGNPNEFSIKELAEMIIEMVGNGSKIVYKPLPEDDPTQRQPDITQARAELNWHPSIALADGLKPTIDYFRQLIS